MPPVLTEPGARFVDLRDEVFSRGYDYLQQDTGIVEPVRVNRWINQAYLEATLEDLWPFRRTTLVGTTPLTIGDLGTVGLIHDANRQPLHEVHVDDWIHYERTIGTSGLYQRGANIIYTSNTGDVITVAYYAIPPYLVNDADTTWIPLRFMDVIVDGAVRRAAKDADNPEAAAFAEDERVRGLALMRRQLLVPPERVREDPGLHFDS